MKLIVIEGPDNTGKTRLVSNLVKYYNQNNKRVTTLHFRAPHGETNEICAQKIYDFDIQVAKNLARLEKENKFDVVILDRSWYSEYVYGQIYRGRTAHDILAKDIRDTEDIIINNIEDTAFVMTVGHDPKFVLNHEDGKSLSKGDQELILQEFAYFDTLFDNVSLDRKMKLEVFDKDGQFIDEKTLWWEVVKLLTGPETN